MKRLADLLRSLFAGTELRGASIPEIKQALASADSERRSIDVRSLKVETRENGTEVLAGYAAVWDTETDVGYFREIIRRGAFSEAVAGGDVVLCWQHDPKFPFARTSSGTLKLFEDDHGLRFEADPVKATWARDAIESIRRGDVTGGSFGFTVPFGGDNWFDDGGPKLLRELLHLKAFDVSVVTWPQYEGTSISVEARARAAQGVRHESETRSEQERLDLEIEIAISIEELEGEIHVPATQS